MKLGWQMVNGVWHQVMIREMYSVSANADVMTEVKRAEPAVTMTGIWNVAKVIKGKAPVHSFMRYW